MESNPPWVEKILTENWTELERTVEPDLLPRASVKPRGRIRRLEPDAEYGCGHYGCVMATSRDGIVCKVTSDASEAEFIQLAWERVGKDSWPDGIVNYHKLAKLTGSRLQRPVWILWRDEAWDVGGATAFLVRRVMGQHTLNDYERRELDRGLNHLRDFKSLAHEVRVRTRFKPEVLRDAVTRFREGYDRERAIGIFFDEPSRELLREVWQNDRGVMIAHRLQHLRGAQRISTLLELCQITLEQWTSEYGLNAIAQALDAFFDQGMLLADVHHQNIGRPKPSWRNDVMGDWVITDPGHLVRLW